MSIMQTCQKRYLINSIQLVFFSELVKQLVRVGIQESKILNTHTKFDESVITLRLGLAFSFLSSMLKLFTVLMLTLITLHRHSNTGTVTFITVKKPETEKILLLKRSYWVSGLEINCFIINLGTFNIKQVKCFIFNYFHLISNKLNALSLITFI